MATRKLTYSKPLPRRTRKKPGPTARYRAKRRRAEQPVVTSVRAQCVERDGYCLFAVFAGCAGRSEWMHLEDQKRARTRGMAPTKRHTTAGSAMGCERHHDAYDAGQIALAMTERGADGPIRADYIGLVATIPAPPRRDASEAA